MKVLYTAFKGINNSSKVLLDNIDCSIEDKLYLTNSFKTSVSELRKRLKKNKYDLIISFGQLKLGKDTIRIELKGIGDKIYETNYDYSLIGSRLKKVGFKVVISNKTNYLCNNIYFNGLKMINEEGYETKMIFIHIPKIKNISSMKLLASSVIDN